MTIIRNRKILNDPVYGFIKIPDGLLYAVIHHPYFQRLRRIRQLGMSDLVYPGATHTRFMHTLGSFHLTTCALKVLKEKNVSFSNDESQALLAAVLLHDIGHGPFSHALEDLIIPNIRHEDVSLAFMEYFNDKFNGELSMAIEIFKGAYHHQFLHALVSSQLDTDRLDYLKRDSFFTGVSEGVISTDRIIEMLNVVNDELVIDIKGLYSVEKFLVARRLMYWQVYLHKTVVSSEMLLRNIIKRARLLTMSGSSVWGTPALLYFLQTDYFKLEGKMLEQFAMLDDNDMTAAIKFWQNHPDKVLSRLSRMYVQRDLYKIKLQSMPFSEQEIESCRKQVQKKLGVSKEESAYFVVSDVLSNNAYKPDSGKITVLDKTGQTTDIAQVSDMFDHEMLSRTVKKYFLCFPHELL